MKAVNPSSEVADSNVPSGIVEGGYPKEIIPILSEEVAVNQSSSGNEDSLSISKEINSDIAVSNILPSRTRSRAHAAEVNARAMIVTSPDPKTYHQAMKSPDSSEWVDSMKRELDALERMDVWEEVVLPKNEHALGTT